MYAEKTEGPTFTAEQIEQLVRFGEKELDWRCIGDHPALCLTEISFTVHPEKGETRPAFERRMQDDWAPKISRSGYPVKRNGLKFHGHGDRFWAIFHCRTPQYRLPIPGEGSCELATVG